MSGYFWQTLLSHIRSGKTLFLLTVCGVALGVASVLCIQILNRNALSAFAGSVKAVSGEADFSVVGKMPTLPENLYPLVLSTAGVSAAWPVYRIDVALLEQPEVFLQIVGLDFFAPVRLPWAEDDPVENSRDEFSSSPADLSAEFLALSGWIAVSPHLASEMGWAPGDTVAVSSGSRRVNLILGALVDFQRYSPTATRKLAVMDIAQVQSLFGAASELHQIDVQIAPGADRMQVMARVAARVGPSLQVFTTEQREQEAAGLLSAFRLNLTALSLISLFVGLFLIYSSVQASLVRRRREFGLLRSLGATGGQVVGLILVEVTLLGALGTVLGIPLGYWAAARNMAVVSATLSNVYLLTEIENLVLPWQLAVLAAGIGIGGALLGALLPALDISRRDTHALLTTFNLHERAGRLAFPLAAASLGIACGVLLWFAIWGHGLRWGGFLLAFTLLVVLPLLTPLFIQVFCGRVRVQGLGLLYSLRNLAVRAQTTSVALAALAVAVSMLIGITILIGSFRQTLETWIEITVRADVYISTESWARGRREATLTPQLVSALSELPGVRGTETLRQFMARSEGRKIRLSGLETTLPDGRYELPLLAGNPTEVLRRLREEGAVLISEPLARKEGLQVGDSLAIDGPEGVLRFAIAGISYDYSSETGSAALHMDTFARAFGPGPVNNIALFLSEGIEPEQVADQLRTRFAGEPLLIRSNRRLREEIMEIFDQTFAITRILQAMALLIAVCGISLTLLILARERVAELALYRSLGALRRQIFQIFLGEGLGLGLLGAGLGLIGGALLALILVFVINRAYFGWTIRLDWPWLEILQQLGAILLAAGLASIYPALRASSVPARELSRDDP